MSRQKPKRKTSKKQKSSAFSKIDSVLSARNAFYAILCIAVLVVAYIAVVKLSALNVGDGDEGNDGAGSGDTYQGDTYIEGDTYSVETTREPTGLNVSLSPNPMTMGWWLEGSVSSNGCNVPVRIYAKLMGPPETSVVDAFLGPDGKYEDERQMNLPGYWEFWAQTSAAISSKATLTVRGIAVTASAEYYSRTFNPPITVQCFSHYTNVNAPLYANDPAHGTSTYITNLAMNSKGYCEVSVDLSILANGNYELDTMINGETAHAYDASWWVTVGR